MIFFNFEAQYLRNRFSDFGDFFVDHRKFYFLERPFGKTAKFWCEKKKTYVGPGISNPNLIKFDYSETKFTLAVYWDVHNFVACENILNLAFPIHILNLPVCMV